jgi:hypothetical protein
MGTAVGPQWGPGVKPQEGSGDWFKEAESISSVTEISASFMHLNKVVDNWQAYSVLINTRMRGPILPLQ